MQPIRPRLPFIRRVIAVASGKGGVGKTTVAVNLALALRARGAAVGLFDADVHGPNVPLMMGVRRRRDASEREAMIPVARRSRAPYIEAFERYGVKIMSVGLLVGERQAITPIPTTIGHIVTQTLRDVLWGKLDFLLIDLPPGTGEPQMGLVNSVPLDGVVIVTTPQDLSLLDSSRSLQMFRGQGVPILGVVENMSGFTCPHCGEQIDVFQRGESAWAVYGDDVPLLARIPMDVEISRGIGRGKPVVLAAPDSPPARGFFQAADAVRRVFEEPGGS